jgi:argininosuccinate lyase
LQNSLRHAPNAVESAWCALHTRPEWAKISSLLPERMKINLDICRNLISEAFASYEAAANEARYLNQLNGLDQKTAFGIVASTIREQHRREA